MYQPARSDLVALALAAVISGLLLAAVEASISQPLAILAFTALPLVPLAAAVLSGPPHSMRSRLRLRGNAAVAGLGATIFAFAVLGDSYDAGRAMLIAGGVMWSVAFSALAFIIVLIASLILDPHAQDR